MATFTEAVSEVREAALAFYQLHGNDPQASSLAATIRAKIGTLSDQLDILKSAGLEIDTDELLKRFRQSVTGGDFDSHARLPATGTSTFVRISGDAQALGRQVQLAMLKKLIVGRD